MLSCTHQLLQGAESAPKKGPVHRDERDQKVSNILVRSYLCGGMPWLGLHQFSVAGNTQTLHFSHENKHFDTAVSNWRQGLVASCRIITASETKRQAATNFFAGLRLRRRCHRSASSLGARLPSQVWLLICSCHNRWCNPPPPCFTTPASETSIQPQSVFRRGSGRKSSSSNCLRVILVPSVLRLRGLPHCSLCGYLLVVFLCYVCSTTAWGHLSVASFAMGWWSPIQCHSAYITTASGPSYFRVQCGTATLWCLDFVNLWFSFTYLLGSRARLQESRLSTSWTWTVDVVEAHLQTPPRRRSTATSRTARTSAV